jgi:tetratricopeptide (TPR) repeat protein
MSASDLEEAIAQCFQSIAQNPDSAKAYANLGSLYARLQQWQQAIAVYQQAIAIDPQLAGVYRNLARIFIQIGESDRAADCWYKAFSLEPKWAKPLEHYNLGNSYQSRNKFSRAAICYYRALFLDSNLSLAYQQLSHLVLERVEIFQSIAICRFLLRRQSQNWYFHYLFGKILTKRHNWEQAIFHYQQALSFCRDNSFILTEILPSAQQLMKTIASEHIYFKFAQLLREKSLYAEAIDNYQQAILVNPNFAPAYIDLQYTPIPPEQLDKLIQLYLNILQQNNKIPMVWGNLGEVLTEKGAIDAALVCYRQSAYQKAIKTRPHLAKLTWKDRKEKPPNFIIIGAAKCGTSSLHNYLGQHPQILLPNKKEINFFWRNFHLGTEWYLSHFPSITDEDNFLTGEASPNYFDYKQTMSRIYDLFPKIKLIVLLRNPVERTISWHYHKINTGKEGLSLEAAILKEIEDLNQFTERQLFESNYRHPNNILGSLYFYKLPRWIERFSREQFLIIKSEDLYENTSTLMTEVFNFLEIPNRPLDSYPPINSGSYPPTDSKIINILQDYFASHNRQLEEFLGIKFNW